MFGRRHDDAAAGQKQAHMESYEVSGISERSNDSKEAINDLTHTPYDKKATRRLLRKIDFYLIPFLALLYLLSFLDRSNIGNARLAHLEESLHINPKSLKYNNALAIFFPFYVAAEIPSNLMMKATRPSLWIPFIMVVWGCMCIAMGYVKNYTGLMVVRACLGVAEGGLFPGITFYLTMWYRRHECGLRMAIFFSAATAAGAFGGILARGIMELDHKHGLRSWQWIFIIEGAITVFVALTAFFFMHDYPDTAKFLTKEDKTEVARRLQEDRSSLDDQFKVQYILDALKDWKIWVFCFITIGIFTPLYAISLFLPTIVKNLGYKDANAQLMTAPPYIVACVFCITAGFLADKHRQRGIYIIFFNSMAVAGSVMLLTSHDNKVKYAGTFLLASGIYSNVPAITAWNGNNIGGSTKRATGMAMQVGIGNLGGTMSAYMFLPKGAPQFKRGHAGLIGLAGGAIVLSIFMTTYLRRENARRDAAHGSPEAYTEEQKRNEMTRGDKASFFRYTV